MMLKFLGSAVVAVSVVFAGNVGVAQTNLPTNDLTDSGPNYVDPTVQNRKRCLERPGLPQWMMEQPLGFEWRLEIAKAFRSHQRSSAIAVAESCDCEMLYPDWDTYRTDLEVIWNDISVDSKFIWNDETRDRYNGVRDDLNDISRPLLPMVTRMCASVE